MCLRNVQKIGAWGLNGCQDINLPTPNVFAQLGPALATGTLPAGMLIPHSGLGMFLCVSGTSKPNLVHGAYMEANILISPLSMYLFNLSWIVGASAIPMGVSTPPKWSRNLPMCLRNLQRTFGARDPNRSWNTDLPTLPCLCATWLWFWVLVLYLQVCQLLPGNLELFLCVSETSKNIWCMRP